MQLLRSQSPKGYKLYDVTDNDVWKRQNYRDSEKPVVWRQEGGEHRGAQGIVRTVKLFCILLYWWIHDIGHLSKPMELYNKE